MTTKQDRMTLINQRLNTLDLLNKKIDRIIELLEHRPSSEKIVEPLTTFVPVNNKNRDDELKTRQKEIFNSLDNVK